MPKLIKDTLPLMEVVNDNMAKAAKNHGLPLFRGVLYSHKGTLDQNLDMYGRPIFDFVSENTVVIGGAVLALKKLFYGMMPNSREDMEANIKFMPRTLNQMYNVNAGVTCADTDTRICLFGCGIGGASNEWGSVYDPDFKMDSLGEMALDDQTSSYSSEKTWIPFRVSPTSTISPDETGMTPADYFFRVPVNLGTSGTQGYAWYLKEFTNNENVPIRSLWQDTIDPSDDGTEILNATLTGDQLKRTDLIECFGECMLTITEDDLREFYVVTGNLQQAKFNQIGLFTGVKTQIPEGSSFYYDYVGVRLFSVVNFNNVSLQEPSTNVYLYRIYSAV